MPRAIAFAAATAILTACTAAPAPASDHADTPLLNAIHRDDAKITDLHVFTDGSDLIILLATNPAIPTSQVDYPLAHDLRFLVRIDNDSEVTFDDAFDLAHFGGTITHPRRAKPDIEVRVTANDDHQPNLKAKGIDLDRVSFQNGIFDDPFIRAPREGRNVFGMAFRMPLADVLADSPTILVWAVAEIDGAMVDLGGRALRSQVAANDLMNHLEPSHQAKKMGIAPDVVIYDTSKPALFPNGRALEDDVVDMVASMGDGEIDLRPSDGPGFPSTNDVPFAASFPFFGERHF